MTLLKTSSAVAAYLTLGAGVAMAHSGHGHHPGLSDGAAHYFSGLDHILASLIVGALGGVVARRWIGAAAWLVGFAVIFGLYHQVAFFRTLTLTAFDAGFMLSAVLMMLAAFGATRGTLNVSRKSRSLS